MHPSWSTSIDRVSLDRVMESSRKRVVEGEFVEDNKEGIIPMVKERKAT